MKTWFLNILYIAVCFCIGLSGIYVIIYTYQIILGQFHKSYWLFLAYFVVFICMNFWRWMIDKEFKKENEKIYICSKFEECHFKLIDTNECIFITQCDYQEPKEEQNANN